MHCNAVWHVELFVMRQHCGHKLLNSTILHIRSVPYRTTADFATALKRAGIHAHVKFYEGKSHTGV